MSLLPIGIRADALHVLIVGGGVVGTRKALALLDAGAAVTVVAPYLSEELRSSAERKLALIAASFGDEHLAGADLVIAATGDATVNDRIAGLCARRHLLCSRADDSEGGTFTMMAAHRAGSVVIGVSAGGVPGAAARIRDEIAGRFDERYARAVERLSGLRKSLRESGEWADAARCFVGDDFCESVETGALEQRLPQ